MCGIIGYTGTQQAKNILIRGLKRMNYRGYDSAGIAVQTALGLNVRQFLRLGVFFPWPQRKTILAVGCLLPIGILSPKFAR